MVHPQQAACASTFPQRAVASRRHVAVDHSRASKASTGDSTLRRSSTEAHENLRRGAPILSLPKDEGASQDTLPTRPGRVISSQKEPPCTAAATPPTPKA